MIRFLICVVLGGVAALFVQASATSFLVGLAVGFFLGWLPMKMAPGCDTEKKKNEWVWFVVQCAVVIAVFTIVVFRLDFWTTTIWLFMTKIAFAIFLSWLLFQLPPLRQLRRRLIT